MSLHVLADHMASKGRNGDSMLVHMTPGEVHGLQALAMKHGGSLTVNPDTGLPEANFLKSLLPMLAGFALGPAGFGLVSSSMGAAALVGGVTGIATGSLSKGLMAGLGAYGGFGIGESLMNAGSAGLASTAGATAGAEATQQGVTEAIKARAIDDAAISQGFNEAVGKTATSDVLGAGAKAAMADPMAFAKQNWKPIAAAALPVLSDIGTTTPGQAPTPMSPGRIREKRWDGRQFVDVASTDANVYNTSGRSFSDLYRGYNDGGIVALAEGGVPGYAAGTYVPTDADVRGYFARMDPTALQSGKMDADIARDMQTYGVSAADIARITGTQNQQADYERRFVQGINAPTLTDTTPATAAEFQAATQGVGLTGANLNTALQNSGLSTAGQYASTHALDDAAGIASAPAAAQDFYNKIGYTAGALPGDQGGLSGLYANINYSAKGLQDQINAGKLTVDQAQTLARGEMNRVGVNEKDIKSATGVDFANLFKPKTTVVPPVVVPPPTTTAPSGYHYENGVLVPNISSTQNTTTNVASPTDLYTAPASSLPVGVSGNTGPSQIGGGATVNPNGTITTSPRIPGIPVGGFTGMTNLRDMYTKGGGSLGYTSPTFKSIEDFNAKYLNRMGGDSLAAYNYLSGKGGAKYPVKSGVGQISEDYATAVLGYPARGNLPYIYNKATGKMDPNPDYVAPGRDDKGNVTYSMSTNDIKSALKDKPLAGQELYEWAMSNKLSAQQIADATGQPLSQVYAQFRAGSQAKAATDKKAADDKAIADAANNQLDSSSTGGEAAGGLQRSYAMGGYAVGGGLGSLGSYSDGGRLLKGPGDGVSDSIPATIGQKQQPARLADGEFVVPARIVSELGNGSTEAGAKKLYAMMDRVQRARGKTTGKNKVAANSRADRYLPA